jgi:hypothetical protein
MGPHQSVRSGNRNRFSKTVGWIVAAATAQLSCFRESDVEKKLPPKRNLRRRKSVRARPVDLIKPERSMFSLVLLRPREDHRRNETG